MASAAKRLPPLLVLLAASSAAAQPGSHCAPACVAGRGLCIEGRCFCRLPYVGEDCGSDPEPGGEEKTGPASSAAPRAETGRPPSLRGGRETPPTADPADGVRASFGEEDDDSPTLFTVTDNLPPQKRRRGGSRQQHRHQPPHGPMAAESADIGSMSALASSSASRGARAASAGAARLTAEPREACVPWLAELRSADLRAATEATGTVLGGTDVDMKALRQEAFRIRVGKNQDRLEKAAFLSKKSLDAWFHGPSKEGADALFNTLDQSPRDGALTLDEYNWENLCGYRQQLFTATSIRSENLLRGFNLMKPVGDSELDEAEFIKASTGPLLGISEASARTAFATLDTDESGSVDRLEFQDVGGLPRLRMEVAEKEPDRSTAFDEADADKDGYLNRTQFEQHALAMGGFARSGGGVASAFHSLDTDKDGRVARAEYARDCQRRTSGMCNYASGCEAWRGPSFCDGLKNGICTCALGFCAKAGACVPEELRASGDSPHGPLTAATSQTFEEAEDKIWIGDGSPLDLSKTLAAAFLFLLLRGQIQSSLTSFPYLTLAVLMFAIGYYIKIVGSFVLQIKPIPGSLATHTQVILFIATCFSAIVAASNFALLLAPDGAVATIVLYFVWDDNVVGCSEAEARFIQVCLTFSSVIFALCIAGPLLAPIPGIGEDFTGKQMLCVIYVLTIGMHIWITEFQLAKNMKSRMIWTLTVKNTVFEAGTPAKGAEWNTGEVFELRRSKPVAWTGQEGAEAMQRHFLDAAAISDLDALPPEGALYYIPVGQDRSMKQSQCHFVRGRVLLIWEGTCLELVQPTEPGVWQSVHDQGRDFRAIAYPNGQMLCPWLRVSREDDNVDEAWEQQAMHAATQAGAIALIIGLRVAGPIHESKLFTGAKRPVANPWTGTYEVDKTTMSAGQYVRNWENDEPVELGSAVDSYIISQSSMAELEKAACEWDLVHSKTKDMPLLSTVFHESEIVVVREKAAAVYTPVTEAVEPHTGRHGWREHGHEPHAGRHGWREHDYRQQHRAAAAKTVYSEARGDMKLLLRLQRNVLATIQKWERQKALGSFGAFYEKVLCRDSLLTAPWYFWVHLFMTALVLFGCRLVADHMGHVIQANGYFLVGECAIIVMSAMCLINCAFMGKWWPLTRSKQWGPGRLATALVFFGFCLATVWDFFEVFIADVF